MDIKEIAGWLNHNLTIEWNDKVANARDILEVLIKEGESNEN